MSPAPGAASPDGRQTGGYHRSFTAMPIDIDVSTIVDLKRIVKGNFTGNILCRLWEWQAG